ncbi:hypothetical protein G3M48_006443 [Beauveria asiatica]|uniref:DNA topoisomerase (ATP-hydrolyzing) n=1 Tax=Beauveria asiatica TaxID=1069075 RepID=A0AAW0S4Q1_9HYPO
MGPNSSLSARPRLTSASVIGRIEDALEGVADALANARELKLSFSSRRQRSRPGICEERHIYYQHQELFETQRIVDELVDDLAYTLGVDRDYLNIGVTIPLTRSVSRVEARHARWLLVVEKDAVFRSLVAVRFWETSLAGRGILVTAKGYPDLMTRSFLAQVQADCPHLPMLVLSDFDPDGLTIFSCYRYGTKNFSHESSNLKVNFGWLGIQSGHLGSLHSGSRAVGRDRVCATRLLGNGCQGDPVDFEHIFLRRELQIMLMLGTKAEIESLDDSGDITSWLDIALQRVLNITH